MTHVFVVNETTFNVHLKYLFAGTGYQENDLSCIIDPKASSTEKTLTGMIADISKLRKDDYVLFYVTGCKKIFGVFQVTSNPFYESFLPNKTNYLYDLLGKNLSFRVMIKPFEVYALGISEQEALDEINNIEHPYQMCWSLIYRKLSGMRGCSFLTDYEANRIIGLLEQKNNNSKLNSSGYEYDCLTQRIITSNNTLKYQGNKNEITYIKSRILEITNSFEVHLQAYITQNIDKDSSLSNLLKDDEIIWIGNEVVCSVGEQRIDILLICRTSNKITIKIIELKDETPSATIIENQIPWYIKWADQYIAPNFKEAVNIKPIIIAAKFNRNSPRKTSFYISKEKFNKYLPQVYNSTVKELDYIFFELNRKEKSISFKKDI